MGKYDPGELVNIHIQSLIPIIQYNNFIITKKNGKGKFLIFCGSGYFVIPIYDLKDIKNEVTMVKSFDRIYCLHPM